MAPKAKKQKKVEKAPEAEAAPPGTQIAPSNALIFTELFMPAIEYLNKLPQFDDWDAPSPLKVGAKGTDTEVGGYMAPFNKTQCLAALAGAQLYTCAIPFPLFDHKFSPTPSVALCRAQIFTAINDNTTTLDEFPHQKVAVSKDEKDFTSLRSLSPEEFRIAKVCNFVRRHKAKQMTDENTLSFRKVLYSVPVTIFIEDNKDQQFVHAIKLRRDHVTVACTQP